MKKYYKFLMIPSIIVIVLGILSGFDTTSEEKIMENLIRERTAIIQDAYYGKIEIGKAIERLNEIETYPLYNKDVYNVKKINEGNIDIVRSMKITGIKENTKMYNYLSYTVNIQWIMRGLTEDYSTMGTYTVVLKQVDYNFKLSEFLLHN